MKILGIDCGLAITGWAVLEKSSSSKPHKVHGYGVVRTPANTNLGLRLKTISEELRKIIKEFKPEEMAVESLFYFKNQKTVMSVGQARGVAILAGADSGLQTFDYAPLQVKMAVTGYGRAEKKQVQEMVKTILNLDEIPKPDDAADALAVGICHLNSS